MFAASLFEIGLECDIKFGREITIIGNNNLKYNLKSNTYDGLHCWLEFDDNIIDFELCKVFKFSIYDQINRICGNKGIDLYNSNMLELDIKSISYKAIRVKDAMKLFGDRYIRNNMSLYKDDRLHDRYIDLAKDIADRYRKEVNSKKI